MGTRATIIWMDDEQGNCSYIRQINMDMGPDGGRGPLALANLKTCTTRERFANVALALLKYVNYIDGELSQEEIDEQSWIRRDNIIKRNFHNVRRPDGVGQYHHNWDSDYLYILNMTGTDITTKDYDGQDTVIENGFLNVFNFGKFNRKIPIVDETTVGFEDDFPKTDSKSSFQKVINDYKPPVISLKDAATEYTIKVTRNDALVIENLLGLLDCGLDEMTLRFDREKNRIEVEGDYKPISCTGVKTKKISDKGVMQNITDAKLHIECSTWMFPSPSYKYSDIKRNLERAICEIMRIADCEVESFNTEIIQRD